MDWTLLPNFPNTGSRVLVTSGGSHIGAYQQFQYYPGANAVARYYTAILPFETLQLWASGQLGFATAQGSIQQSGPYPGFNAGDDYDWWADNSRTPGQIVEMLNTAGWVPLMVEMRKRYDPQIALVARASAICGS